MPTLRRSRQVYRRDMITALAVTVQAPETLLWLTHEFGEGA